MNTTPSAPNLRVGALNINGLTQPKLTELLWYMRLEQLDVFFVLDTRTTRRAGKFLGRQACSYLGLRSVAQVSPARPAHNDGNPTSHALVGGAAAAHRSNLGLCAQILPQGPHRARRPHQSCLGMHRGRHPA